MVLRHSRFSEQNCNSSTSSLFHALHNLTYKTKKENLPSTIAIPGLHLQLYAKNQPINVKELIVSCRSLNDRRD